MGESVHRNTNIIMELHFVNGVYIEEIPGKRWALQQNKKNKIK
jgi:hypothetical protein